MFVFFTRYSDLYGFTSCTPIICFHLKTGTAQQHTYLTLFSQKIARFFIFTDERCLEIEVNFLVGTAQVLCNIIIKVQVW